MAKPISLTSAEQEKQRVATAALEWVQSGMLLGLGSGSTAAHFITQLGAALRAGRYQGLRAVAASRSSESLARQAGIPLVKPRQGMRLALTVDGADELDHNLCLLKGGGGALLREKVLARAADSFLILADSTKLVKQVGRFPLALEVVPFALPWVLDAVAALGGRPLLRPDPAYPRRPARTDQRNLLIDAHFGLLEDPAALAGKLADIPGLVEHGLFLGLAQTALVARGEQVLLYQPDQPPQVVPQS